ncbi:hypothetical protein BJV78DRAFT_1263236 [Lactifluus subvellereus]|nr:hypothetical protein BJV78DRAFT_1263236 [Lactifluus subvellereus]
MIDMSGLAGCPRGEQSLFPEQIADTDAGVEILLLDIVRTNGSRTFDIRSTYMLPNRRACLCS